METILDFMIAEHGLLKSLFELFKSEATFDDIEKAKKTLYEFSLEMRKHFSIEENIIFNFMSWDDNGTSEIVNRLRKEHGIMIEDIEKIFNSLNVENKDLINKFELIFYSHNILEEDNLYPNLDGKLSIIQKKEIIEKINQIKKIRWK